MKNFRYIITLLFTFNLVYSPLIMAYELENIKVGEKRLLLDEFNVNLYVDKTQSATIDDVISGKLAKQQTASRFSLPLQAADYWFSFTLHNQTMQPIERVIVIDEPFLYKVDLYSQNEGGDWNIEKNGVAVPIFERANPTRLPHFSFNMAPGEIKKVYLYIATKHSLVAFGISVKDPYIARRDEQFKIAAYWLFFGVSLAMLIYNLFLFLSLRDSLYFYYSFYCASFLMFVMQYSGFHLLVVQSSFIHYALASFVPLTLGLLSLFIGRLLQSKKTLPRIHIMLNVIVAIFFVETILTFINTDYYFITLLLAMPVTLFLFIVTVYAFIKKIPLANYLLFGMSWHVLGLFAITGLNLGLLEYGFFTRYGFIVGSLIELFVFSLALVHRVRLLQQEKNEFQYELLAHAKKEKRALKGEIASKQKELLEVQNRVAGLQRVDILTGLFNRHYFNDELIREWRWAQKNQLPMAIILAEFKDFTLYRESYGQQTGDYSLRLIGQTLIGCVAQDAEIVARYSENRFALLVPDYDKQQINVLVDKIRASIDAVKIPFKESETGRVDMLFIGDAMVPDLQSESKYFLNEIEQALN